MLKPKKYWKQEYDLWLQAREELKRLDRARGVIDAWYQYCYKRILYRDPERSGFCKVFRHYRPLSQIFALQPGDYAEDQCKDCPLFPKICRCEELVIGYPKSRFWELEFVSYPEESYTKSLKIINLIIRAVRRHRSKFRS